MSKSVENIKRLLRTLPKQPGVYRFYDGQDKLLYIGKAKNLKNRVGSYFSNQKGHSYRITKMVSQIRDMKYTVVNSETEALLLENNLIKTHQPKYNILLKDGKTYPFVAIKNEEFPRVFTTRKRINDGSHYFGPFPNQRSLSDLMKIIADNFKFRSCNLRLSQKNIQSGKFKVCLEYQIGNCLGPCVGHQSEEDYNSRIANVRRILSGKFHPILQDILVDMKAKSENYEYEAAEVLRKKYSGIKSFVQRNTIFSSSITDVEVLAIKKKEALAIITHFKISEGSIIQTHSWEIKNCKDDSDQEIMQIALDRLLIESEFLGNELILNIDLSQKKIPPFKSVNIPQVGDKKAVIDLAVKNCLNLIHEKTLVQLSQKETPTEIILKQMQKDLRLTQPPAWIECIDNSNIQGNHPVASLVVFKNGKPSKKDYRKYKIKTVIGPDDFASMNEVLTRRYKRLQEETGTLPDLIIVDGGKGQLSSAYEALVDLKIEKKVPILGIAKKLEELYFVNDSVPLHLDKRSTTLKIIQQLRNEAHRFAITFHRNLRSKKDITSALQSIKGIGPLTAKKLLKHYGSIAKIKDAGNKDWETNFGLKTASLLRQNL